MATKETNSSMSKGQERRLAKKREAAAAKRKKKMTSILVVVCLVLIIAAIVTAIILAVKNKDKEDTSTTDEMVNFSEGLDDNGFVDDVDASSAVSTIDYKNVVISRADIEYTDEEIDAEIADLVDDYSELSKLDENVAQIGDAINIDFVGTIDGVEFEGGNSNGNGQDITLGAHRMIDDFEEQIVGMSPGETRTIEVTFPDPYDNNPDLAGKDASFEVTLNGVYVTPEFTDEFVANNLSDTATTVAGYREAIKKENEENNLKDAVEKLLQEESEVVKMPEDYLETVVKLLGFSDLSSYNYYNDMLYSYTGSYPYSSFSEYTQMTDEEYQESLEERAENQVAVDLAVQSIFEQAGLTITDEELAAFEQEAGDSATETYGEPYMKKCVIYEKVIKLLCENAVIQ